MLRQTACSLILCLTLAACAAQPSPEDQKMADILSAQGRALLTQGKWAAARDMYASATNRDETNARAWNGLGVANDMLGKRDEAMTAYQHAVDLTPDDVPSINNLGHLYLEMGKDQEAVDLLKPHAEGPTAPLTLKQNYTLAEKALQAKEAVAGDVYADLGSYPTEGMADGHMAELRKALTDPSVVLAIEPEVKIAGGTPTFVIKATGRSPESICSDLQPQAFPCMPHGK